MKFDLSELQDTINAKKYLQTLESRGAIVEIIRKSKLRTYSQNAYLHLLLSICALTYGENLKYFKEIIWKQEICSDIFETTYTNPRTNKERPDWRSSADLTTKEFGVCTDRLISWAAKNMDLELPLPEEIAQLRHIENEIEKYQIYL